MALAGYFTSTVHLGRAQPLTVTSAGGANAYLALFTHAGEIKWVAQAGGASFDTGDRKLRLLSFTAAHSPRALFGRG